MSGARANRILAAAFLLSAAAFDSPSLYVPGVALLILDLGLLIWVRRAAAAARLDRTEGPWSIVEGTPYPLEVRIERGRRLPLPGGQVVHPMLSEPLPVGPWRPRTASPMLRFPRRGRWDMGPATLVVADPFGLHTAEVRSPAGHPVLVLPRVEPVLASGGSGSGPQEDLTGASERGAGGAGLERGGIDFEIDGLRPHRYGSPASRIHWPTVARTGEFVELRLVAGGEAPPLVVLDSSDPAGVESLDQAVRAAASLCVHLGRLGGCAVLLPGQPRPLRIDPQLRCWPEIHARLAVLEAGGTPARVRPSAGSEAVFWVCAGSAAAHRAAARRTGYLVSPVPVPGLDSIFTVAGCHGQSLRAGPVQRQAAA